MDKDAAGPTNKPSLETAARQVLEDNGDSLFKALDWLSLPVPKPKSNAVTEVRAIRDEWD